MSRANILAGAVELSASRPYPERAEEQARWHDRVAEFLHARLIAPINEQARSSRLMRRRLIALTNRHDQHLRTLDDDQLRLLSRQIGARLRRSGFTSVVVGECFALVREAASRALGRRHYESQIIAGWALLEGRLVEMATGEGKTFAATLPACVVALAGYPVHVITVNDYLARRDAQLMEPLYGFLGLSVGTVVQGMPRPERRAAYAQSITYGTNKELAFDYLRDGVVLSRRNSRLHLALESLHGEAVRDEQLVLRGLYFAIVDEADSVFIDEACTPLILSLPVRQGEGGQDYGHALELAGSLDAGTDFVLEVRERRTLLLAPGRDKIADFVAARALGGVWTSIRAREELVNQALSALLLYKRDQQYVVTDNKVQIVDESTGRVMPDRSWERGLHQLIETKEACEVTERRETLARLTYQRLFRRYIRLSGMTGTATEVAREIKSIYRLAGARVPLNKPSRRIQLRTCVCTSGADKWELVADQVQQLAVQQGRPVLIGTRSVKASESISAVLTQRGIEHGLLNAKQDASEAEVIARTGLQGRVTVATNIAGRGTDIVLGPGVAEKGGLHVILTEYHESRRVDRQLIGRCGRQGDPGSCQAVVSLEDEIFTTYAAGATAMVRQLARQWRGFPALSCWLLRWLAQSSAERKSEQVRRLTMEQDKRLNQVLAFSGRGE